VDVRFCVGDVLFYDYIYFVPPRIWRPLHTMGLGSFVGEIRTIISCLLPHCFISWASFWYDATIHLKSSLINLYVIYVIFDLDHHELLFLTSER